MLTGNTTGPAVAGKNASNTHPIYQDWRSGLPPANGTDIHPEIQQQIDFIKAKANQRNPDFVKRELRNNIMGGSNMRSGQAEPVNNYRVDHIMPDTSPTLSAPRQPAQLSPELAYPQLYRATGTSQQSASRQTAQFSSTIGHARLQPTAVASQHPAQHARVNGDQTTQDQLISQPSRQMICPRPMDHLKPAGINLELHQTIKMMSTKDKAIQQLAQALDTAVEKMELQQVGAAKEIQTLINLVKYQMEKDGRGDDLMINGHGHSMDNFLDGTFHSYVSARPSARNDTINGHGNSVFRDMSTPDVLSKITGVGDNLMRMMQHEKGTIDHLKAVKENVGINMENVGEDGVLPKGWLSHDFTI